MSTILHFFSVAEIDENWLYVQVNYKQTIPNQRYDVGKIYIYFSQTSHF